jgi:glycerol uptake facilitator-like aquaporin
MSSNQTIDLLVEFIGTFIFLSVIINTTNVNKNDPIALVSIAVALLAVIYFGGRVSGGHFNPAVSVLFKLNDATFTNSKLMGYVIAQLLGAVAAGHFNKMVAKTLV